MNRSELHGCFARRSKIHANVWKEEDWDWRTWVDEALQKYFAALVAAKYFEKLYNTWELQHMPLLIRAVTNKRRGGESRDAKFDSLQDWRTEQDAGFVNFWLWALRGRQFFDVCSASSDFEGVKNWPGWGKDVGATLEDGRKLVHTALY